jgi:hypothetical protein
MIKLGNFYTNSAGEFIKIVSTDESDPNVFLDQVGRSYHGKDGAYYFNNPKYDLSEITTEETFNRIDSILNKVPEILPCPFCGNSVDMWWDDSGDYSDETPYFQCSSRECGFMYHPQQNYNWNHKRNSIEQKRTIERHCVEDVNRRT